MEERASITSIEALAQEGKAQEALAQCEELLQEKPQAYVINWQARLLCELGRKEEGLGVYESLIQLHLSRDDFLRAISTAKEIAAIDAQKGEQVMNQVAQEYSKRYKDESTLPSLPSFAQEPEEEDAVRAQMQRQMRETGDLYASDDDDDFESDDDLTIISTLPAPYMAPSLDEVQTKDDETLDAAVPQETPLPALFNSLDPQSISAVLEQMLRLRLEQGTEIIRQGSMGDTFYIIVDGTVRISHRIEDEEEELGYLGTGQFFGEIALLTPLRRTATVTAATDCELFELSRTALEEIIQQHPRVFEELRQFVYRRLIQNLLSTSLLFFPLPDAKRWGLARQFQVMEVPEEYTLVGEGVAADGLYLIAGGEVDIYKSRPDGENTFLSRLSPGQFFGELSLLTESDSMCSLISHTACTLLKLDKDHFHEVMQRYPRVVDLLKAVSDQRYEELNALDRLWQDLTPSRTTVT